MLSLAFSNDLSFVKFCCSAVCFLGEEHFTELLNLVKDQRLYSDALELFPSDSQQYKVISFSLCFVSRLHYERKSVYIQDQTPASQNWLSPKNM